MDVVYPIAQERHNEALKYSMRSLCEHLDHDRVWHVGYTYDWVRGVFYIPTQQLRTRSRFGRSFTNIKAAVEDPRLSEDFILMNDDFFIMEPIDKLHTYHRGTVDAVFNRLYNRRRRELNTYLKSMKETKLFLKSCGIKTPLSYELHIPMILNKEKLYHTVRVIEEHNLIPAHIKTVYGNLFAIGGEQTDDVKLQTNNEEFKYPFMSTSDASFSGPIKMGIQAKFPKPSIYEKRN